MATDERVQYTDYDNGRMLLCESCGSFVHPSYEHEHSVFHLKLDVAAEGAKLANDKINFYQQPKR